MNEHDTDDGTRSFPKEAQTRTENIEVRIGSGSPS
jgi:hypothetical protein